MISDKALDDFHTYLDKQNGVAAIAYNYHSWLNEVVDCNNCFGKLNDASLHVVCGICGTTGKISRYQLYEGEK